MRSNHSRTTSLLCGTFKMLTLSIFLGFGLTSCSNNTEEPNEPVAAEGAAASDDAAAPAAEAAPADSASAEAAPAPDAAEAAPVAEAPPAEESVVAMDDGAPTPPPAAADDPGLSEPLADHPAEEAAPTAAPELADSSSDTVKAELTDHPPEVAPAPAAAVAAPAAPAAGESLADTFDSKAPVAAAAPASEDTVNSSNSVSSPGAARFITGRHEGKHHSHKMASHKHHRAHGAKAAKGDLPANVGEYVVVAGDTLGRISRKIYGTPKSWTNLAELNGLSDPYIIHPREALKYDASSEQGKAFKAKYQASLKTIDVKPGDSLSKIAAQVYGDANAWPSLLSLNKDQISDPNQLTVGMKLNYVDGDAVKNTTAAAAPAPAVKATKTTAKVHKKRSPASAQPSH